MTQAEAARKLGVSQPYLSLLEKDLRPAPARLARKVVRLYRLPATALPLADTDPSADAQELAEDLAGFGYSGFSHLKPRKKRNPAEWMFVALSQNDLESRLTEALPWVAWKFAGLDWNWLVPRVQQDALQNRLGFVTDVARRLAEARGDTAAAVLAEQESVLDDVRLVREGTLCNDSMTNAEREWLRDSRSEEAKHWNLLTDLKPEHVRYAA